MFISLGAVPLKRSAHLGMDWGGPSIQAARVTCSEPIQAAVVMNAAHPATFVTVARDPEQVRSTFQSASSHHCMSSAAIGVELQVKPGHVDAFRALTSEMVEGTKRDRGALSYDRFIGDDEAVHVFERYSDSAADSVVLTCTKTHDASGRPPGTQLAS